jgi:hypothetical protein
MRFAQIHFSLIKTPHWLHTTVYRLRQVRQQLGFVAPLCASDHLEVARALSRGVIHHARTEIHHAPTAAISLFQTMSPADQQHCLRVYRGLQARGCTEKDLLAAALLHDVGKGQGRVPFWTRPLIVIGKLCAPHLLARLVVYPYEEMPHWRRSLSNAWYHADVGADLAAAAGLSERTVLYIRTHHQPRGPAAELHAVDEDS